MICAGEGAGVIANIWNGSSDKRNICTILSEKQTSKQERKKRRKARRVKNGSRGKAEKAVGVHTSSNLKKK